MEFSDTINQTVNLTPQAKGYLDYRVIIEDFNTVNKRRRRFLRENSNWEKSLRENREFAILSQRYNEFCGILLCLQPLGSHPLS